MPQVADAICKLHLMKTAIPRCCFETAPPKQIAKLHLTKRNCQTAPRKGVVLKLHLLKKLQFPNCTLERCSFQSAPGKGAVSKLHLGKELFFLTKGRRQANVNPSTLAQEGPVFLQHQLRCPCCRCLASPLVCQLSNQPHAVLIAVVPEAGWGFPSEPVGTPRVPGPCGILALASNSLTLACLPLCTRPHRAHRKT